MSSDLKDAKGRFSANDLWATAGVELVRGERPEAQRRDQLQNRLQDVPHPCKEGRLGVRPGIPRASEAQLVQMNANLFSKEIEP
jgi:hypothetical protein